ncbi:unnamed protein product [Prorocentrum cordatum]|uniref:Uncharacterized protein n=1 Tax=Prorocentrum cordatum TaxID=2364126 RepID=A0ABN9PY11_9DINO|nr:unnamed protein product [Polarella glacialis]
MSDRYASLDVPQLSRIATERGIECPQLGEAPQEDRELLALLLRAYDAGRAAAAGEARERPPSPDALGGDELRAEVALQIEVLEVLRTLSSLPGHRGIDIGGTLSKTILGVPREALQNLEFKASFGKSGRLHRDLAFSLDLNGTPFEFVFFSGTTSKLEEAITFVSEMRAMRGQADTRSSDAAPTDQERHRRSRQIAQAAEAREDLRSSIIQCLIESDFGQTVVGKQPSRLGRVHVSGGGACKYPPLFLNAMGLSIEPVKELRAMVEGLLFLQETSAGSRRNDDPQGDLYTVDQDPCCPWPVEGRERGEKEQ